MEMISREMLLLIAPLILIQLILMIIALIDIRRVQATNGPKWMWVLVVIFINMIGPIAYFIVGRKAT